MKHKWLWSPVVFPPENEIKEKSNKTKFSLFFKSSRRQALYKNDILKNLAKSTGNRWCLSLFVDKVAGLEPLFEHLFYWTPWVTAFVFWKMISCRISMFHTSFEYKHVSFILSPLFKYVEFVFWFMLKWKSFNNCFMLPHLHRDFYRWLGFFSQLSLKQLTVSI